MDTSLDTSKEKIPNALFFPDGLRDKKLKEDFQLRESKEPLEQYLETEDPKHLFKAISANNNLILQGSGIPETYLRYNNIEYVDAYTIVWVSIYHWQWLHISNRGRDDIVDEAERRLIKVGRALIPYDVKDYIQIVCNDGLIHKMPKWKNSKPYLTYSNPKQFIERYNRIKKVFEETKSKKRYNKKSDAHIKRKDAIKAIKQLGNELFDDDIELLDLTNIRTKTASYICLTHENLCLVCKKKGLQYKTILRLYNRARKELKLQLNSKS